MKYKYSAPFILILCLSTLHVTSGQTEFYNEETDGELSTDHMNPTGPFVLDAGGNTISASQGGDGPSANYFSFTIPDAFGMTMLTLDAYDAASGNQAFLGMQAGDSFTTDASSTSQADLLGGILYGEANVGDDILPTMANLSGAQGFDIPLAPGTYTIWLNQTGPESSLTLNLFLDTEVSVTEFSQTSLKVTPNPAHNTLNIRLNTERINHIHIIDITGRTVQTITGNQSPTQEIDLTDLKSGIYFASIRTDTQNIARRFIKE